MVRQDVQRLGQEQSKIRMCRAHGNLPVLTSLLPLRTRIFVGVSSAMSERQVDAEPRKCEFQVLLLAAPFGRLTTNICGAMHEKHTRFHLVAMLASGARSTLSTHVAFA